MKNLTYNSEDFIKSKINYSQDKSTASIDSVNICNHLTENADKDAAFNEAVEFITEYLEEYLVGEYSEDGNNGCSMIWNKKMSKSEFAKTVKIYSSHSLKNNFISITFAYVLDNNTISEQTTIEIEDMGGALTSLFYHLTN